MSKTWLRRMMWSHIPLFLIVFSFLIFIFLQAIVEQNRQNAKASGKVFTAQLLQSVHVSLKTVDHLVIRELLNNKLLSDYFEEVDSRNIYLNYEVLERLNELKQEVPLIDSFYLYRYSDGTVLSGNLRKNIDAFEDRVFARSFSGLRLGTYWSDVRDYRELASRSAKRVISVVHEVPVNSGSQGILVMNIDVSAIQASVSLLYDESTTFVNIFSRNGQPIYSDNLEPNRKVMTRLTSDYTGWTVESGMNSGLLARSTSAFSSVWFGVGVLVFAIGLLLTIYVARANYKPLEQLVVKLHHSLLDGNGSAGSVAADEFAFIESAINNFVAQSKLAEREFSEAAVLKRKHAFSVLIYGDYEKGELSDRPFEGLDIPDFDTLKAIVIEVDNAEQAFFTYNSRDRSLFKFVVSSVVNEMMQQPGTGVWLEWTSPIQLSVVIFQNGAKEQSPVYEPIVDWIAKNLKFTVTVGVGRTTNSLEDIRSSYKEACSLLHFKAVLGTNRVIRYSDAEHQRQKSEHEHLRTIHEISTAFRLGEEKWRELYGKFFNDIRLDKPAKSEIVKLVQYMFANLELHHSSGSKEEYQIVRQALEDMRVKMESFDTLDDLSRALYEMLDHSGKRLQDMRSPRSHYPLLQDIKDCIEKEYANPDLSLDYLSDKFDVSSKYLSRLFKETFGENFLEFLASVRIGKAKELLVRTENSVQEVGEKVGYPNSATFRRVFRKTEGLPPQDYRSRMRQ
ncbi:helix-turn-helix domain-containing protein [Cohnella thailandensis]|uniref:Helix-turn-helix domain-containing protein n=1 Tax=Cohnella thailandensis TaxID=557557 RepID=A0A841SW02_9BACL|nr:helix-turn-helix domain-containing protein [Cohnella thailandensis]MBB6632891.1 helix-turn-helix domain-containing protein [Cohnella thailandensis]MBP1975415.1 AraC-like DNA-binding protein [Cohnella thailandensis]